MRRTRKNFLPTFILAIIFWAIWFYIFFFLPPQSIRDFPLPSTYLPFFFTLFFSLFLTFSLVFADSRRGLLASSFIILILILRLLHLGNFLNLFLLLAVFLVLEYYFSRLR